MTDPGGDQADRLRSIILAQSADTIGAPVLLFTESTTDPMTDPAPLDRDPVDRLRALMVDLDIDPDRLQLFGTDAYALQTALGAQLLDDDD